MEFVVSFVCYTIICISMGAVLLGTYQKIQAKKKDGEK